MACPSTDASAGDTGQNSLDVVPHAGHVVLQLAFGQHRALAKHKVTLETQHLPRSDGEWTLVIQYGFEAVSNTESDDVIEYDELFTKSLVFVF